ncbi:MAG: Ig-like domain-containing protein [Verrucomicrobiota bacterium]
MRIESTFESRTTTGHRYNLTGGVSLMAYMILISLAPCLSAQKPAPFPAAPVAFKGKASEGKIELSWNHSSRRTLTGFELERSISPENPEAPISLPIDADTYTDERIVDGLSYTYHLYAVQGDTKSEPASLTITGIGASIPTPTDPPPSPEPNPKPSPNPKPNQETDPTPVIKPRIVRQSGSAVLLPGVTATLIIEAEGTAPLEYQWFYNGIELSNATEAFLQIGNFNAGTVGNYVVRVTNSAGSVLSNSMRLDLNANQGQSIVEITWDARFESANGNNSEPVGVFHQGSGALVAGTFNQKDSENRDFLVISYDSSGTQNWAVRPTFNDNSQETAEHALMDGSGNIIVGGVTLVNPADLLDEISTDLPQGPVQLPFIASVGTGGGINWTFTPPVSPNDIVETVDVQMDQSGTLYLLANIFSEAVQGMVLQPIDIRSGEPGEPIWSDPKSPFLAEAMAVSANGRIYVLGVSSTNGGGLEVRCYRPNGRMDWATNLASLGYSLFAPDNILLDPRNALYLIGTTVSAETGANIQIIHLNSDGSNHWQNQISLQGMTNEIPEVAIVDSTGALIVAGTTSASNSNPQIIIGKFLPTGGAAWASAIPASSPNQPDQVTDIDLDAGDNIYLSAIRTTADSGQDFASLAFSPTGALAYETRFQEPGNTFEEATHIDSDSSGNVLMTGYAIVDNQPQIITVRQAPRATEPNEIPEVSWNDKFFKKPVIAPGKWTLELDAKDPDGNITKVEFLEGLNVLSTDTEAPFTYEFSSETAVTRRFFARAFDDQGGVTISDVLTVEIILPAEQGPVLSLAIEDKILTAGSDLTLDYGVVGNQPLRYQWFLNGERLKGADQETLPILPAVTRANSGSYQLRVENRDGKRFSDPVTVSLDWTVLDGADQFSQATPITGNSGNVRTSNDNATLEAGEPRHANKRGGKSIWYIWRPDASGLATLSLQGSSFDTLLSVYAGNDITQLTEVERDDDRGGFSTSALQFNAQAGVDYLIAIDGFNNASGNILFSWDLNVAQLVSIPRVRITPEKNTVNLGEPYQLTASVAGNIQNVNLQWVHNGTPVPGATGTTLDIAAATPLDAGAYWITLDAGGNNARTQPAHLTVNVPRRGGRIIRELVLEEKFADLFFNIQDLRPGLLFQPQRVGSAFRTRAASLATGFTGAQIFNTFGATKEAGEPDHCGIPGGASQWFAYEAPADGDLTISTDGSDFDTVMAVYTSSGSSFADLTEVICDNDSGADGLDSLVTFSVTAGTVYFIAVDGVEAATGTVNLAYELDVGMSIQNLGLQNEGLQFEVQTVPGLNFLIEGTEDMIHWSILESTSSVEGTYIYIDTTALPGVGTLRFYRVTPGE